MSIFFLCSLICLSSGASIRNGNLAPLKKIANKSLIVSSSDLMQVIMDHKGDPVYLLSVLPYVDPAAIKSVIGLIKAILDTSEANLAALTKSSTEANTAYSDAKSKYDASVVLKDTLQDELVDKQAKVKLQLTTVSKHLNTQTEALGAKKNAQNTLDTQRPQLDGEIKSLKHVIKILESLTAAPTASPTAAPIAPTAAPTASPTAAPTAAPTASPTVAPIAPTAAPTASPTTVSPTAAATADCLTYAIKIGDALDSQSGIPYMCASDGNHANGYYPICGHNIWDDQYGADLICKAAGFVSGTGLTGQLAARNDESLREVYNVDSIWVGRCTSSQNSIAECALSNNMGAHQACTSGKSVGFKVECSTGSQACEGTEEISMVTCDSSTQLVGYECQKAIDGDTNTDWATQQEGAGAWIQLYFDGMYYVSSVELTHRLGPELFKDLTFEFSNGQSYGPFTLDNINGGSKSFRLPINILSSYIKIQTTSHYSKINNGFKEIKVYGCPGLSNDNNGCHVFTSEAECMRSKDGRQGHSFTDSPCDWCCGDACTGNDNAKCEPHQWLMEQADKSASKNDVGYDTCPADQWSKLCSSCDYASPERFFSRCSLEECKANCEQDRTCTAIDYGNGAYVIPSEDGGSTSLCYLNSGGDGRSFSSGASFDAYVIHRGSQACEGTEEISRMTCKASTQISTCKCEKAIDGDTNTFWATIGEATGAWIQLDFDGMYYVSSVELTQRLDPEMFKDLTFEFSNGQIDGPFTLDNNSGGSKSFSLPNNILSSYIKIKATSHYSKRNNGFKEIKVYGCPG